MMAEIFSATFITGLLGAMMRMATPIIFAMLGEIITERSGVLNLGIEGIMLMGAMTGFLVTLNSGSLWLGVAIAAVVGMILAFVMAILAVYLGLSQHVSGLGITLLSTGLAMFIYRLYFGSPTVPPIVEPFARIEIPLLARIPILGQGLFNQYSLTYVAWLLIPAISILLYKTKVGLKIRTVGENPFAADTVGVNVTLTRTLCLVAGGALMGIGGAFLTLAHQNMFLMDVVGGRGWVAVAMVISVALTCRRRDSSAPGCGAPPEISSAATSCVSARCSRMRTSRAERLSTSASSRLSRISTLNQLSMPRLRNCTAKK